MPIYRDFHVYMQDFYVKKRSNWAITCKARRHTTNKAIESTKLSVSHLEQTKEELA